MQLFAGLLLLASVLSGFGGMWSVFACVFIYVSAQGFVFPNGSAIAMMRHGEIAGTASALLGTNQFLIAALTTTFLGFIDNPALPMAIVIAGVGRLLHAAQLPDLGAKAGDGAASGVGRPLTDVVRYDNIRDMN